MRFESFWAVDFAKFMAPSPPPFAKPVDPETFRATARRTAAKVSGGAGAVRQAGHEVAPALPDDGPGSLFETPIQVIGPAIGQSLARRPKSDTGPWYPPRRRLLPATRYGRAQRYSGRTQCPNPHASGPARGDRSRFSTSKSGAGTRSGYRRGVSLSPVPAPHIPAFSEADGCRSTIRHRCDRTPRNYHKAVAIALP